MEHTAKLISSLASLAWPIILATVLYLLRAPLKRFIDSWVNRKVTIKIAGNELTIDEASELQRISLADVQAKIAILEKQINTRGVIIDDSLAPKNTSILWVDDRPKNNAYLVASLRDQGISVDLALTTEQGVGLYETGGYDAVVSDMGRPEGQHAGLDLFKRIRAYNTDVPFFIFCSARTARNMKKEALECGVTAITSSGTTLLSFLQFSVSQFDDENQ